MILDCRLMFESADEMRDHLVACHGSSIRTDGIEALAEMSERPKSHAVSSVCPLCCQNIGSLKEYARHVGRHQRVLSMFALPRLEVDGDSDGEDDEMDTEAEVKEDDTGSSDSDVSEADVCLMSILCRERIRSHH